MGMQLNDVKIVGNVVKAAEVRYTASSMPVANVSLGVNQTYAVDDQKKTLTTFVDVQLWGQAAENFARLVHKGEQIFVEGSLRQEQWTDKESGKPRSKLFVNAATWQFVQFKGVEAARQAAQSQEVTR